MRKRSLHPILLHCLLHTAAKFVEHDKLGNHLNFKNKLNCGRLSKVWCDIGLSTSSSLKQLAASKLLKVNGSNGKLPLPLTETENGK